MRKTAFVAVVVFVLMIITSCNLNSELVEISSPITTQGDGPMVLCKNDLKIQVVQGDPSLPGNKPKKSGSGSNC